MGNNGAKGGSGEKPKKMRRKKSLGRTKREEEGVTRGDWNFWNKATFGKREKKGKGPVRTPGGWENGRGGSKAPRGRGGGSRIRMIGMAR